MKKLIGRLSKALALTLALVLGLSCISYAGAYPASAGTTEGRVSVSVVSEAKEASNRTVSDAKRIKLNYASVELKQGERLKLKLLNAGDKAVNWSSDKPKFVRVTQKGWVTALKAGKTARITATCNGKSYKCIVRVAKDESADKPKTKVNNEYIKVTSIENWGKYKSYLEYDAPDKESLFEALLNGFERGAETVRVYIPSGQGEAYVNHYTGGVRDDLFEQLLSVDRVLSGYANNFNMTWKDTYVDFYPEYKATWKCILSLRFDSYKISDTEKKMIKKVKKMVNKAKENSDDPVEILSSLYDQIAGLGTYRYYYTDTPKVYSEYDAASLLFDGSGVCEAYASVMQIACELLGYPNIMVAGFGYGDKHAWNKIKVNG